MLSATRSLIGSHGGAEPERLHPRELLTDMDAPVFEAREGRHERQPALVADGHADPRTTERYSRRKSDPDDHASDYVRL